MKNIIPFVLFFFLNSIAFGQSTSQILLQKIDEENGLSDNNVQAIYKDNKGFMWIGTASGLNLIDGSTITVFKNIPDDKNSISNNSINCITSDSNGILWIGTKHGLNALDPVLRKFTRVQLNKNSDPENNFVNNIAIDKKKGLYFRHLVRLIFL